MGSRWRGALTAGRGLAAVVLAAILTAGTLTAAQDLQRPTKVPARGHAKIHLQRHAQQAVTAPAVPPQVAPYLTVEQAFPVPAEVIAQAQAQARAPASLASTTTSAPSPAAAASFPAATDTGWFPPDTQGAVGPNHLVVALNGGVRVQTRAGETLSYVSLAQFWQPTGASSDVFDPKLEYDPLAGRWIMTAVADRQSAASSVLIGVSETSDPTGHWFLYRFDADAANLTWADYPSLGYNKDWIAVSLNMFAHVSGGVTGPKLFVFPKALLYAGDASLSATTFIPTGFTVAPAVTLDSNVGALYLVQNWNGNSSGVGTLKISSISGAVGAETFTDTFAFVSTAHPWSHAPPQPNFVPQLGTSTKLHAFDARMLKVIYRHGALWAVHTAFLPAGGPTRTAVQWWQFTPGGTVQQFGRIDDPSATFFRAFPSLAVNAHRDVLIGYGLFSAATYAGAAYSMRYGTDPPGMMRAEVGLKAGEDWYVKLDNSGRNRWGDYSATVVDPVNDLDFWTIQEYAAPQLGGISKWGTWWGRIVLATSAENSTRRVRSQLTSE